MRTIALLVVLVSGVAPRPALAQSVDPSMWVTNGEVNAIASSGSVIYIGGNFTQVGPNTGSFVGIDVRPVATQTAWPKVAGVVICCAPDGAGGSYIGGSFSSVGGVPRANLAHIRADMTLDGWDPGADGSVRAIAVNGTNVYTGGSFTSVGGVGRNCIAAIDAGTGVVTAWNPSTEDMAPEVNSLSVSGTKVYVGGHFTGIGGQPRSCIAALDVGTGFATDWNPSADGSYTSVSTIAVRGRTVYVGGHFSSIGGQPRSAIAALDDSTGLATSWNPGADDVVWSLVVSGTTVYVGGHFTGIGGQPRSSVAGLDAGTGLATAWNPSADGSYPEVYSLVVSGTTVYAGGSFSSIGGKPRSNIAALDLGTGKATAWNPGANNTVETLALSGTTLYAGGWFTGFGGQSRNNLAALDAATGQANSWDPEADSTVYALAASGSTVYAGGEFTAIGGQGRSRIAALDAGTGAPIGWNPGADNPVRALAVSGATVYAGGEFTSVGGQSRSYIAAVDAATGTVSGWNPGANSSVASLSVSGRTVYVGGFFTGIGGKSRNCIAALDSTTGLATTWNPSASGGGAGVFALAVSETTLYVGGRFDGIGRKSRSNVAALSTVTGLATAWNPGADMEVHCVAIAGSTVYAGGYFTSIGGQSRSSFVAVDAGTGLATTWDPGADNVVEALAVGGARVYAGGLFLSIAGQSKSGFAAIDPVDAAAPGVQVLSPNGGVPLLIGAQRQLKWNAIDNLAVQSVDLYLSRAGASGPWTLLAAGAANTGSYVWTVTAPAVTGSAAYLRVNARDYSGNVGTDVSDAGFDIVSTLPADVKGQGGVTAFALAPPSPNPTRSGRSLVSFAVPTRGIVRLSLLDVQGREVAVLADGMREPGRYTAPLDATGLRAGMYFVRMQAGRTTLTRRMAVVR